VDPSQLAPRAQRVISAVESAIIGKNDVVELALAVLLSNGHLLIEDIPGVGKTTLAKALARALGLTFKRIQFTPDLLPADITGSTIYNQKTGEFEVRGGPVFANIVLADEINRTTPKTQAALLECMEEQQVTIDGETHPLPSPFFVIATQNNIEMSGTYPLPEAQMDRFAARIGVGYPDREAEMKMLTAQRHMRPVDSIVPAMEPGEILAMQSAVRNVTVRPEIQRYILDIVIATREMKDVVALGASPRGSLALLHASQARAALLGRDSVIPDDVKALATVTLAHRLIVRPEQRRSVSASSCVMDAMNRTRVPVGLDI
jgi:MoxR-like ATPase